MNALPGFGGVFRKNEPTTPSVMSNNVSVITKKINPKGDIKAKYFTYTNPVTFSPYEQECYYNVARMIREHGGEAIYGWVLWESDIMIEGEAHCLYKDLSGNVFDITPRVSGEEKILFIEDSRLNVSLKHIKGARFSMIQHTNPQLFFSTNFFVESKAIPFVFDQNEIRVIKLIDYKGSFLFQ
ncbi:TPA: hypothetical protein ACNINJ_004689 [Klebsiella pneumoniae]|uniref:hypothetical protein n=1 Tax=Klebsiella pneumoniae complex TaxID=3390273 RepID=UPI00069BCE2E|nr:MULTISPECIES: hypothetical protein [Klebsiella]HDH1368967.1 hypothetical protein [Klebsiella quasipneumoniae subsp. similipneumoniae]AXO73559.1 hypothetical protein BC497_27505 [Klebsiella variicola]EKW9958512.1 hypothetical protein [Klebsiella pneumoniae]ELI7022243.1 hypothetical protein [Klebsiella pneumoniae]ELI7025631.1 hypothetical protein [Klebsiella pneumoniae]